MMKILRVFALVPILYIHSALSQPQSDPPDFVKYIGDIRTSGMSESARSMLYGVASVRSGATLLTFKKDDQGNYSKSYQSTICPFPNTDKVAFEEWSKEIKVNTENELQRLKPLADTDSSGFISTEEGQHFRELIDFAIGYQQISPQEYGNKAVIANGLFITVEELEVRLIEYAELLKRAKAMEISSLPSLE